MQDFVSSDLGNIFVDSMQFFHKFVNIGDPLQPANNLGKTVTVANRKRMQRCFQLGAAELTKMLNPCLSGESTVSNCLADFDLVFIRTLAELDCCKVEVHELEGWEHLKSDLKQLQYAAQQIVMTGLGGKFHAGQALYFNNQ